MNESKPETTFPTTTTDASSSSSGTLTPPDPTLDAASKAPASTPEVDPREAVLERKRKEREDAREKEKASCVDFVYSGPHTHVTYAAGYEVQLTPGSVVKLPPDDEYTKSLVDRGYATRKSEADKAKARSRARKGVN